MPTEELRFPPEIRARFQQAIDKYIEFLSQKAIPLLNFSPSTSEEFDFTKFLLLPWHIQRKILGFCTLHDLLNIVQAHDALEEIAKKIPKNICFFHGIEYGIRKKNFVTFYECDVHRVRHPKAFFYRERRSFPHINFVYFVHPSEEKLKKKFRDLVLSNCRLHYLKFKDNEEVRPDVFAKCICMSNSEPLERIFERLKKHESSVLELIEEGDPSDDASIFNEEQLEEFSQHPTIKSLEALAIVTKAEHLHYFLRLPAPQMILKIDPTTDFAIFMLSTANTFIEQWTRGEREIDIVTISLSRTPPEDVMEVTQNFHNFEIHEMAKELALGLEGHFADSNISDKFKLIRRPDGTGLLIASSALTLVLCRCDYESRKTRGLGSILEIEALLSELSSQYSTLMHFFKNKWNAHFHRKKSPHIYTGINRLYDDDHSCEVESEPEPENHRSDEIEPGFVDLMTENLTKLYRMWHALPLREHMIDWMFDENELDLDTSLSVLWTNLEKFLYMEVPPEFTIRGHWAANALRLAIALFESDRVVDLREIMLL